MELQGHLKEALDNTKEVFFSLSIAGLTLLVGYHSQSMLVIVMRDTAAILSLLAALLRGYKAALDWRVYFSSRRALRD
ncbi:MULTISPECIES: hypothetical protein [Alicyclobacillus]|uniref:hypothetical protein n=1 Tax=Alicyclobacillus TaxID=29330 RepID=UPI00059FB9D7|nr:MULTISPECIES: hypothetical protein [Alicyclobacillus]